MKIVIPDFCLVVLFGGPGQPLAFVQQQFQPEELIPLPGPDISDAASGGFPHVLSSLETRLRCRQLSVVDATGLASRERAQLVSLAVRYYALPVAIVLNPKPGKLQGEGFRSIYQLSRPEVQDTFEIARTPLPVDRRGELAPFDIIGDVHGCASELEVLLARLGYQLEYIGFEGSRDYRVSRKSGRRAIFAGDFVDRGPRIPDVLRLVMAMAAAGEALCVLGNHDDKFLRWLKGHNVTVNHGLEISVNQIASTSASFRTQAQDFLESLEAYLWLDGGNLVVTHAGINEPMIGRSSPAVREFCLYGDTTGEKDESGLPVRRNWAAAYEGPATIVYGHTPVLEPQWFRNTICIDTGCVFGGALTALRWPERDLVSVPSRQVYWKPQGASAPHRS